MFKFPIAVGAAMLFSSAAWADQVTLINKTDTTIYRIYAWPTDLMARTYNVLNTPVLAGATALIDVDNSYGDCDFTIEYDINAPSDLKKRRYKKKELTTFSVNLCLTKHRVQLRPDEDSID